MTAPRRRVLVGLDAVLLRALVVLGACVAVVSAELGGARPATWVQLLLLGLAGWTALRPESAAGAALLVAAAYVWATGASPTSAWVLGVAAGMALAHVAALVAAQGPGRMPVDGAQVRLWGLRGLLLWTAAAGVWGVSVALADLPDHRLAYAAGLTVLIVLAVAGTGVLGARPTTEAEEVSRPRGAASSP